MSAFDLAVVGGAVVTPHGVVETDVAIAQGRIARLGPVAAGEAAETFDARGLHVLPGVIDSHVHFREPGPVHKEDMETGSRAALLGGVTAVCEMPNTEPVTTSADRIAGKLAAAAGRMHVDYAFYIGATHENAGLLGALERLPGTAGVKLFMGSSTGSLLVEDDAGIARVLASGVRRVAVHAEDEARLRERRALVTDDPESHAVWRDAETARRATERLIALARAARRRVHVLHTTTADEIPLLAAARDVATVEVTVQHLTLAAPECYRRLGAYAQMNPPLRDESHRAALWRAVQDGLVDTVASDHAPHTRAEKDAGYPKTPSGLPGVQTLLPVMLDHVHAGRLTLQRLADLTSAGPARVFGMAGKGRIAQGYDADLTLVDLKAQRTIENAGMASRCGWTPFDGMRVTGWPVAAVLRGAVAMRDGAVAGAPIGRPLRYVEVL